MFQINKPGITFFYVPVTKPELLKYFDLMNKYEKLKDDEDLDGLIVKVAFSSKQSRVEFFPDMLRLMADP